MLGAIPNPQKTLQINQSIEIVSEAIQHMVLYSKNYKLFKSNSLLNQYTFEASEFLSFGVYIDITCTSSSNDKTDIKIEIRRKIGAFDKSYEVTQANQHIQNILDLLSETLSKNIEERRSLYNSIEEEKRIKKEQNDAAINEANQKYEEFKKNNPIKHFVQQFAIIALSIGILAGGIYLMIKMLK